MSAVFSPCRNYRYSLERELTRSLFSNRGTVAFIGLNGSKGAETQNDPTLRRCIDFSEKWGFSLFRMLNLYGWMSTDPDVLKTVVDPVGPDNDRHIVEGTANAKLIICGWGTKAIDDRPAKVLALLREAGRTLHCLKRNDDGTPTHPLYLPSDMTPIPFGDARP